MSNEITVVNTATIAVFGDTKIGNTYSSFSPEDMDGKIKLYNAINAPDHKVADLINQKINMRDVVISHVKLAADKDDEQQEDRDAFRVIIIDDKGTSYTATSQGIYNSMCTLRNVFGELHFEQPLPIIVKQIKTKNGNTLSIQIASK